MAAYACAREILTRKRAHIHTHHVWIVQNVFYWSFAGAFVHVFLIHELIHTQAKRKSRQVKHSALWPEGQWLDGSDLKSDLTWFPVDLSVLCVSVSQLPKASYTEHQGLQYKSKNAIGHLFSSWSVIMVLGGINLSDMSQFGWPSFNWNLLICLLITIHTSFNM